MRKVALLALMLVAVAALAGGGTVARAATLDSGDSDLLAQVNSFRASRGLSTLVVSHSLTMAAKWMAADMSTNNYLGHTSLDGRSPTQRMADAGYPAFSTWAGEDLAAGYTAAGQLLQGWIDSPAHLAVLTNPAYRVIGIGRAYSGGSRYGWYWAADFAGLADRASPTAVAAFDRGVHSVSAGPRDDPTLQASSEARRRGPRRRARFQGHAPARSR